MDWRVAKTISLAKSCVSRSGEQWSLTVAARTLNLSASRLSHIFKEQAGVSPARLVKSLRLQRASELLVTTTLSIKEVMTEVGFNDKSYFTREFQKALGMPPSVYRSRSAHGIETNNDPQILRMLRAATQENSRQPYSAVAKLSNR